jgi:hypothetical protein
MQTTISYQSFVFKSEGWSISSSPHKGLDSHSSNDTEASDRFPARKRVQVNISDAQSTSNGKSVQQLKDSFAKGLKVLAFELSNVFQGAVGGKNNIQSSPFNLSPPKSIAEFQPPSASEVAKYVLGFVESRLQKEKANGASDEKLNKLFDAARSGVKKGFAEAKGQIKQLGLGSDKLSAAIEDSQNRINKGIDQIQKRILSPIQSPASSVIQPANQAGNPPSQSADSVSTGTLQRVNYASQSLNENAGNIKIKTQDGDVITVSFKDISALQQQYAKQTFSDGQGNNLTSVSYDGKSLQTSAFKFSVKGSLDSGELKAIGDLLGKVGDLAQQFFGGDVQGAFQHALSLGYDGQQIANFSLNLSQTQYQKVSAYQSVSQLGDNVTPSSTSNAQAGQNSPVNSTPPKLDALSSFVESLSKLADQSRQIGIPPKVPSDIISRLLGQSSLDQNTLNQQQQYLKSVTDHLNKANIKDTQSGAESSRSVSS